MELLFRLPIYTDLVQSHLAPSDYFKIPNEIEEYLEGCKFLPYVNNEKPSARQAIYKERFISLNKLVLIMTALYIEDWIGLRTLNEAGKVSFLHAPGDHIHITDTLFDMVVPFLKDDPPHQRIAVA